MNLSVNRSVLGTRRAKALAVAGAVTASVLLGSGAAFAGDYNPVWGGGASGQPAYAGHTTASKTLSSQSPKMTTKITNCIAVDPGVTSEKSTKQSLQLQVVNAFGQWVGTGTQSLTSCGTTYSFGLRDPHEYRLELHAFTDNHGDTFDDGDVLPDTGLSGNVFWHW